MIVYLEGILKAKSEDHIVLLAGGIGYQVFLTRNALETLPQVGAKVSLHTHLVIREDVHQLYGFLQSVEKALFLKLIQVSSIGPKLAITILSGMPVSEFAQAIHHEDLVRLTAIPGIGKKTAERLIVDLKDKVLSLLGSSNMGLGGENSGVDASISEEALSALVNLGYSRQEAAKALRNIHQSQEASLETLVREGLKALS